MPIIDEEVVRLSMDNASFNKNTESSIKALDSLKAALNFDNQSTDGFDKITNAAKKVSFDPLINGIENVGIKFNGLTTIADAALRNITNRALNYGTSLVKSLSVDNIAAGWNKFGNKTISVGTLVSQGYELEEVNEQLKRLNWYTDETSYNFTDMVSNIAKFTAAGKGLTESVDAMQGIANWAALSGQNATTASHAMYQISQAMSAGVMRKEDYKSIQTANMDTQEFRQHALDAAVALGTLKKNADGTYQSLKVVGKGAEAFTKEQFLENLTTGQWFTSDVMMDVFNDYSAAVDKIYEYTQEYGVTAAEAIEALGDELDDFGLKAFNAAGEARTWGDVLDSVKDAVSTGWMNTFELIFGDYEEAKKLFTDAANSLYEVFMEGINQRNEMLEAWKEAKGRAVALEGIYTMFRNLWSIVERVKEAFHEVFPPTTTSTLLDLTYRFSYLMSILTPGPGVLNLITQGFKGIFKVGGFVADIFKTVFKAASPLITTFSRIGKLVMGLFADFGKLLSLGIDKLYDYGVLEKLYEFVNKLAIKLDYLVSIGIEKFVEIFSGFIDIAKKVGAKFSEGEGGIIGFAKALSDAIKMVFSGDDMAEESNGILGLFYKIFAVASEAFATVTHILSSFVSLLFGTQEDTIGTIDIIVEQIQRFFTWITGVLNSIDVTELASLAMVATYAYMLFNLANLYKSIGKVLDGFSGGVDLNDVPLQLLEVAAAVTLLVRAFSMLASMNGEQLMTGLLALAALMAEVLIVMKIAGKLDSDKKTKKAISSFANQMLVLSVGLNIMVGAVTKLAALNLAQAAIGIGGLGLIMAELLAFTAIMSKIDTKGLLGVSVSMTVLAIALTAMTIPVKILSTMNWNTLAVGLAGLGGIMLELSVFSLLLSKVKPANLLAASAAITIMSAGILVMSNAVTMLGSMSLEQIGIGLLGLGGILVGLTTSALALSLVKPTSLLAASSAIAAMSSGISIISNAVISLGNIDAEQFKQGLLGAIALIGALTLALAGLAVIGSAGSSVGLLAASAGLIALSVALNLLIIPITALSLMSWEGLAKGLAGMAGALGILIASGALAGMVSPGLMVLSASLLAIGASIALASIGIESIAKVFAGVLIVMQVFGDEAPTILMKAGLAISGAIAGILVGIRNLQPQMTMATIVLMSAFIEGLSVVIPKALAAFAKLLEGILNVLIEFGPKLIDGCVKVIEILTEGLPKIRAALSDFIDILFTELALLLREMFSSLGKFIVTLITGKEFTKEISDAGAEGIGKSVTDGAAAGIVEGSDELNKASYAAGEGAVDSFDEGFCDKAGIHSPSDLLIARIDNFVDGIEVGVEKTEDRQFAAGYEMGSNVGDGVKTATAEVQEDVENSYDNWVRKMYWKYHDLPGLSAGDYSRFDDQASEDAIARAQANYEKYKNAAEAKEDDFYKVGEGLGSSLSSGTASGATKEKEKTAEEIVNEYLQAISDAYSRGVEQLDISTARLNLQDKMWNLMNKEGKTDAEKAAYAIAKKEHEIEMLDAKMQNQLLNIASAQAAYEDKLNLLGSSAVETQKAYNTLLEEQYNILDLYSQKQELMSEESESTAEDFIAASREVQSYRELVEKGLITNEMYMSYAQERMKAFNKQQADDLKKYETDLDRSIEGVLDTFEKTGGDWGKSFENLAHQGLSDAIAAMTEDSEEFGWSVSNVVANAITEVCNNGSISTPAEGLGVNINDGAISGLDKSKDKFVKTAGSVMADGLEKMEDVAEINSPSKKTKQYGIWLDEGLANGLLNDGAVAKVLNAADEIARKLLTRLKAKLGVSSPSKQTYAIAKWLDIGMANGLGDYSNVVMKSSDKMVSNLLSNMKSQIDQNGSEMKAYLKDSFGLTDADLRFTVIVDADTSLADASLTELERAYAYQTMALNAQTSIPQQNFATVNGGDNLLAKLNEQETYRATQLQNLYDLVNSYVTEQKSKNFSGENTGDADSAKTIVNNFNQTNISPKPISALDTYRNTQKQLNTFAYKVYKR